MANRQEMLARIRRALGREGQPAPATRSQYVDFNELGDVLPPIPKGELVPKFESELTRVSGAAYRARDMAELQGHLRSILGESRPGIVLSRNPLLQRLDLSAKLQAWGMTVAVWPKDAGDAGSDPGAAFRDRSFAADFGITGVDFILAESGTLVLSSATEGAQLASLAPPVHVALYRREQVLGSLEEVLARLPVPRRPEEAAPGRAVVFITGPSRTADIEQILIRGVHGPRHVHAILVEEACLA